MEHLLTFLFTVTLTLTPPTVAAENTGAAEVTNAQAISGGGGGSSVGSDNLLLVRRYVPRFVGKRDPADADNESLEHSDNLLEYDPNKMEDYFEKMVDYYDSSDISSLETDNSKEDLRTESNSESFHKSENDEFQIEDSKDENNFLEAQEEKRYVPSFVGKRTFDDNDEDDTMLLDKRYQPKFIGKRYNPKFVGKRYTPRFVGKRYLPKFIGKRYTPRFVGKRYTPLYVGKRYTPRFVGKRFAPKFIGKRYTPKFIGKRYTPKFIGKRFQPVFVGKKSEPISNLQEKRYTPYFVGKRDQAERLNENQHVEKRSVSNSNEISDADTEMSSRRKRSLTGSNIDDMKLAWRTYTPWKRNSPSSYAISEEEPSYLGKRFVAPEFIGRRDSLSSILSALDALQFARNEPRSTSKRFEAPLFVGKRGLYRPFFVGKKNQINTREMNVLDGLGEYDNASGLKEMSMDDFERISSKYSPFTDTFLYSGGISPKY